MHPSCACVIEVYRTIVPETTVEQDCILNGREYGHQCFIGLVIALNLSLRNMPGILTLLTPWQMTLLTPWQHTDTIQRCTGEPSTSGRVGERRHVIAFQVTVVKPLALSILRLYQTLSTSVRWGRLIIHTHPVSVYASLSRFDIYSGSDRGGA